MAGQAQRANKKNHHSSGSDSPRGPDDHDPSFDVVGARNAMLAALHCVHEHYPNWTLTQLLVSFEAMVAEDRGETHTVVSLAKMLNAPVSTISRVILSLAQGEDPVLIQKPHPTDLRKKLVVLHPEKRKLVTGRVLRESLLDYYGDSVIYLRHRRQANASR